MKVEIENLRKQILNIRKSFTFKNAKSYRYPPEIKLEAISLINEGVPLATLSRALGIKGWRISEWIRSLKSKRVNGPAFKEIKILDPIAVPHEPEARIVTVNGISIFIPLSSLTAQLIASIGGLNV